MVPNKVKQIRKHYNFVKRCNMVLVQSNTDFIQSFASFYINPVI